ncbi:MAG: serine/threonine protein kinase, partial [Deltaproteobacteria bacterium]
MDRAERDEQPRSLGRYELLFRIAAGGMAEVYAARVRGEAGFQKLVAVKRMLPQLADDEEFTTMFLDEARLAANISSPHCVSTLDLGRA